MSNIDQQEPKVAIVPGLSRRLKWVRGIWMLVALVGIVGTVWTLLEPEKNKPKKPLISADVRTTSPIRVAGPSRLILHSESPMRGQLKFQKVESTKVEFPLFTVSGSILARVTPGSGPLEERWQFATADLSATYADWVRTKNDLEFAERAMAKSKQLSTAEVSYRKSIFTRLEALGQSKAVPEKDIQTAKADLLRAEITGERDIFEAQRVVFSDMKVVASLERSLRQTGLEPDALTKAEEHTVLIGANVPESRISEVHIDQLCQAHLFGLPSQIFPAHVEAMATSVSSDRRMLKMVFHLLDPKNQMKPGMFAEVGLGTNSREAILVSSKAIIHLGSLDYILVVDGAEGLKVREVITGEPHQELYEILHGLTPGETIISQAAVLLKPLVRESLLLEEAK